MKTLTVLSALVSITLAAPALPGDGFNEFVKDTKDLPELIAREKKSPAQSTDFIEASETSSDGQSHDFAASSGTGRSFGFKKPIIVKKKVGYHLYRDSDEEKEQADSRESCNEKIKVKLCKDKSITKSSDMLRNTAIEDIDDHNMATDEMTHSLKIAKEAIESLERDLHKSQKPGMTMTVEKKNEDLENDSIIHKDIDAARQALEHIHRNFENFESMSLHTTTSKDAESLHDVHLTIAKTEEERMAQWKEAIDNIQKNVEIAKNIEDSFKSTQELPSEDLQTKNIENIQENTDHHKISAKEDNMRATSNLEPNKENLDSEKQCKSKSANEKVTQKNVNEDEKSEDDMHPSASTVIEMKLDDSNNEKKNRNGHENNKNIQKISARNPTEHPKGLLHHTVESKHEFTDHKSQARNSDFDSKEEEKFHPAQLEHDKFVAMESDKDKTEKKTNEENTPLVKTTENNFNEQSTHLTEKIKSVNSNQADTMECNDSLDKNLKNEKSPSDKSNNNNHKSNLSLELLKATDDHNTLKKLTEHSDEKFKMTQNDGFLEIENKEIETSNFPMNSFDRIETSFQESMGQSEDFMRAKTDHADTHQTLPSELRPLHAHTTAVMKSVGSTNINPGQSKHPASFQRSQDKNSKVDTTLQKAANELRNDFHNMDHSANTHFSNSNHMTGLGANGHNKHHMHTHESKVHNHVFHNTESTMPTMNMRDATGNFGPENNMLRWKPNHESARTAYGSAPAASAGASAVGMFPNANVGNCAVPILLSCSPSVIQGNLAKALPVGYGAPAYRTEDEFSIFPTKREIKKMNDIPGAMAKKDLVNLKDKPAADNKQ